MKKIPHLPPVDTKRLTYVPTWRRHRLLVWWHKRKRHEVLRFETNFPAHPVYQPGVVLTSRCVDCNWTWLTTPPVREQFPPGRSVHLHDRTR